MRYIMQSHNKDDACNIPNKYEVEGPRIKRL